MVGCDYLLSSPAIMVGLKVALWPVAVSAKLTFVYRRRLGCGLKNDPMTVCDILLYSYLYDISIYGSLIGLGTFFSWLRRMRATVFFALKFLTKSRYSTAASSGSNPVYIACSHVSLRLCRRLLNYVNLSVTSVFVSIRDVFGLSLNFYLIFGDF